MSGFKAVIPGQPLSLNHMYRNVWRKRPDGSLYKARGKTDEAETYQRTVWGYVRQARPQGWTPPAYSPKTGAGLLYIDVRLYLKREIDADNLAKLLCDGIKDALNCDDRQFLVRFQAKTTGCSHPRVELEITAA